MVGGLELLRSFREILPWRAVPRFYRPLIQALHIPIEIKSSLSHYNRSWVDVGSGVLVIMRNKCTQLQWAVAMDGRAWMPLGPPLFEMGMLTTINTTYLRRSQQCDFLIIAE